MKKIVSKFIQSAVVLTALVAVVSVASAWTPPTDTFPAGNVPATVNTGNVAQTKASSFSVTGNLSASSNVNGANGFFSLLVNSAKGRFGCFLFCSDIASTDILKAGKYTGGDFSKGLTVSPDGLVATEKSPLWINLAGNTGVTGRNGLAIFTSSDNLTGGDGAVLQTSADKFSLVNLIGSDYVGLRAKRVQLTEGAGIGKVLTSDADGNGSWSTGAANTAFDIYEEVNTENDDQGHVYCNAGYRVLGGGGNCGQVAATNRAILVSEPTGVNTNQEGWWINCSGTENRTITTRAICMKITGATVTGTGTVAGVGGVQVAPGTWQRVTSPTNPTQNNISCNAWLSSAYSGKPKRAEAYPGGMTAVLPVNTYNGYPETCAYQFTTAQYQRLNGANVGPSTTVPIPAEQYGGVAYWSSTCIVASASAQFANAKPVQSCTDNNSQFTTGGGQTSTKKNLMYTQVQF